MAGDARVRIEADVWRVAVVVILGMMMSVLDTTIVNIALKTLSIDLKTSLDTIQWVVTAYLLSLAAVLPITGWASRRFGARRLYLAALVMFTAGSALCGLAHSASQLILFRVIQGVGGGMIMPIGQMIMVKKAGTRHLARVMAAAGVPVILAPVIGPTVGGLLLQNAGWQWIFLVNLPVGVIAFLAGIRMLPRDRPEPAGRLDAIGMALVSTGVVGVTYGLAEIGATGSFTSSRVLVPTLAGAALVAAFVFRSLHIERPLLDLRLYANKGFSASSLATFALGAALFGGMILMPLYFQTVRHEDAVTTGLLLAPQGIGAMGATWLSGRAVDRFGAGMSAFVGSVITIAATMPFVLIGANTPFAALAVAMVVRGFGVGMAAMPAFTAGFRVLSASQVNDAAPQLNILMRVGGSIGTAILAVVLQHHLLRAGDSAAAEAAAFGTTFWWVVAISAAAVAPTVLLWRQERRTPIFSDVARGEPLMEAL